MVLMELLQNLDATQIIIGVGAPAAGGLWVFAKKKLADWRTDIAPILKALNSLPSMRDDMARISYYVAPNGGGSLADSIKHTEVSVAALAGKVDSLLYIATAEDDADEYIARFHCNPEGENTFVNKLYARWMGVSKSELLGWKFLNYIEPADAARIKALWDECRAQFRACKFRTTLISATGERIPVEVNALPMPENPPIYIWIGTIRKLDHDRRTADRT